MTLAKTFSSPCYHCCTTILPQGLPWTLDGFGDEGDTDNSGAESTEDIFARITAPNPGAFLGLHLRLPVGPQSSDRTVVLKGHPRRDRPSRPAIGAQVLVHLPDGRRLVSQVDGGSGHSGKRAPDIHLRLGKVEAGALLKVEVRWRGADGKMRSRTLQLTPGWHTVWLGLESLEGG
jgi:hypothetical protein